MVVKRLDKLPKRKVTVDEILDREAVVDILNELFEVSGLIEDLVVIWTDGESIHHSYNTDNSRLIALLETTKYDVINEVRKREV